MEGVYNLCKTSIIQNVWASAGQEILIHGWVYDLGTGFIKDLEVSQGDNANMSEVFKFK